MSTNGSSTTTDRPSYQRHAKESVLRAFSPAQDAPPDGWIRPLAVVASGIVYALLDIAEAIRETRG